MEGNSALLFRCGRLAALAAREQPAGSRDPEGVSRLADLVKARGGFFCSFSPEALAEICQRLVYLSLPPEATCLQEGHPCEGIALLATGRMRLRRRPARNEGDDELAPSPATMAAGSSTQEEGGGRPSGPPTVALFARIDQVRAIAARIRARSGANAEGALRGSASEPVLVNPPVGRQSHAAAAPSQQQQLDVHWRSVNSPGTELAQSWLGRPSLSLPPATAPLPQPGEREETSPSPLAMRLADVVQELAKSGAARAPAQQRDLILGRTASDPTLPFAKAFANFCESIGLQAKGKCNARAGSAETQPEPAEASTRKAASPGISTSASHRPPPSSAGTVGRAGTSTALAVRHAGAVDAEGQQSDGEDVSRSESSSTSYTGGQHSRALRSPILAHLRQAAEAEHARQSATKEVVVGQLLGVRACLSEHPATCTAAALEPCEVLILPKQDFWECLDLESGCRHAVRERSLLAALPGLRAMEREKFRHLAASFRTRAHRRGASLCMQGEVRHPGTEGDRLHILMEGEARIVAGPSRPSGRPDRGSQAQEVDSRPQPRYVGALLPGQVVNGASQLLAVPEPFSIIVESAEATVMDIARSELARLAGSGPLDDLRSAAEAESRWRAQHLEASQEALERRARRPPQRPAGFAAGSGSLRGLPEELMHEGRRVSKKDFAQRRSPPDARAGLGPEELLGVATTAATPAGRSLQLLTAGVAASASREEEEAALARSATAGGSSRLSDSLRTREGRTTSRTLRQPKRPAVSDGLLWPPVPSCNPTGGTTSSTLLEQTQRLQQEPQALETTLVPTQTRPLPVPSALGLAATWGAGASSSSSKSSTLFAAALEQLTTARTALNESLTPGHLERLAMRGDAALLVPVGTLDPMEITALVPTQHPPAPALPAPVPAPAPPALHAQRRTPQTVRRRPWVNTNVRLPTASRHRQPQPLEPELERTLPVPSQVSPSDISGSSTGRSASSHCQARVLLQEEPPAPRQEQLDGLEEALALLGELQLQRRDTPAKEEETETETPSGIGIVADAAASQGDLTATLHFWDTLYASVGHRESALCQPRPPSTPKSAGRGPRPPASARPLRPQQAHVPPRLKLGPQRLKGLTPVHTPAGRACLRRAGPLHVHGIGHWLDTAPAPVTAR